VSNASKFDQSDKEASKFDQSDKEDYKCQ